jgi:hypothetical protein
MYQKKGNILKSKIAAPSLIILIRKIRATTLSIIHLIPFLRLKKKNNELRKNIPLNGLSSSVEKITNHTGQNIIATISYLQPWKKTAWVFNVARWKRHILKKYFPEFKFYYLTNDKSVSASDIMIRRSYNSVFIVWGMTQPSDLEEYAQENNIPLYRIEDGFIRSIGLGTNHALPLSICFDKQGLYYDSSRPSDLELLLQSYDFDGNPSLIEESKACISKIQKEGLSKYNETQTDMARHFYGPKTHSRILILGQVEDDNSLLYGCDKILSNVELIKLVCNENPGAQIIYKPHPDVIFGKRKELTNPSLLVENFEILPFPTSLKDALHDVDRVYTLTSLGGFEALLHGVPVTTLGAPFYSGWGLTEDRQVTNRRTRTLTLEEVFAAAYLLYPRYLHPKTHSSSNLSEILDLFLEELEEAKAKAPKLSLDALRPINLATGQRVNPRFLYKTTVKNLAIISDHEDTLKLAQELTKYGSNIVFITTRDSLANNLLLPAENHKQIKVGSIHKLYGIPFSLTERKAVELIKNFSSSFVSTLNIIKDPYLSDEIIAALAAGFEDSIYHEALRFYGAQACLKKFDATLLHLDNENIDSIRSFIYHAKSEQIEGRLFISSRDTISNLKIYEASTDISTRKVEIDKKLKTEIKSLFSSFWDDIQLRAYHDYTDIKEGIAVCGNIDNENYNYSPASIKLLEICSQKTVTTIYFSSALMSDDNQEKAKSIIMKKEVEHELRLYNGCMIRYKEKYSSILLGQVQEVCEQLHQAFLVNLRLKHSTKMIDVFSSRIEHHFKQLASQFIFISEARRIFENISLFATCMDRAPLSRVLAAVAKLHGVPSIGIQPVLLSTSPRYIKPAVQKMGVIDSSQLEVYRQLGAPQDALYPIGSINLISRLMKIEEYKNKFSLNNISPTILFALQHSNPEVMISVSLALKEICEKIGAKLVIKPHPHQEAPVVHEVRAIFADCDYAKIMSRNGDTYEYMTSCSLVVGLFSNVLMEAAIAGIDVVVANFLGLDNSVNFAQIGLALESKDSQNLEYSIKDILTQGPLSRQLKDSRENYLNNNPHLKKPYSLNQLEGFIESNIAESLKPIQQVAERLPILV